MEISKEQQARDSIVRRQYAEWLARSNALHARTVARLEVVEVISRSRPGVVYSSMAFLQRR